jgi:hypothetical protein
MKKFEIFKKNRLEVFIIAFSLLFLESVFFKTALYIHDYLNALLIISYALTGLGIGAILNHHFKNLTNRHIFWCKNIIILSIILSLVNFIRFPEFLFFSPTLIIPFASGNIIISHFLRKDNAYIVYFFDLTGATIGIISSLVFIPLIKEENCFILLIIILSASLFFNPTGKIKAWFICVPLLTLGIISLVYNISNDKVNFANIVNCSSNMNDQKIFCLPQKNDILFSKSANTQRIEAVKYSSRAVGVAFDGVPNDFITNTGIELPLYEPRIIYELVNRPHALIIGTSAQGIVKTVKSHNGRITGLEINPRIIELMQGPMHEFSQKAYDCIDDLYEVDARSFLENNSSKFDIITLMNSHYSTVSGLIGPPTYLHTFEAINLYLDHLSENGYITFEERFDDLQTSLSTLKILNTVKSAMKNRGVLSPKKHIYVYQFYFGFATYSPYITFIVVKPKAFTTEDWEVISDWKRFVGAIRNIYPKNEIGSEYSHLVHEVMDNGTTSKDSSLSETFHKANFSVISDDKPFPWATDKNQSVLKSHLLKIGFVCLILLIILAGYWKFLGKKRLLQSHFILLFLYFGLIGLGYFIIETGLIHFYQIYTGSPTRAFVFILGTLLFSSGLGSYFSKHFPPRTYVFIFIGISVVSLYHLFINRQIIIPLFIASPLANSILIAITVFPLGFLMGIPFPHGIEFIKKGSTHSLDTSLFFAINCIFSTFAVMLSFYLSVAFGFIMLFSLGIICYFLASCVLLGLQSRRV